jgi:hypothetical protein
MTFSHTETSPVNASSCICKNRKSDRPEFSVLISVHLGRGRPKSSPLRSRQKLRCRFWLQSRCSDPIPDRFRHRSPSLRSRASGSPSEDRDRDGEESLPLELSMTGIVPRVFRRAKMAWARGVPAHREQVGGGAIGGLVGRLLVGPAAWPASTATVRQLTGNGTLFPRQTKHDGSEALILPLAGHGLAMIEPSCRRFHPSLGAISKSRDRDDDTMDEDET